MRGDLLTLGVVGVVAGLGAARGSRSALELREWEPDSLRSYLFKLGRYMAKHKPGGLVWKWADDGLSIAPKFPTKDTWVRIDMHRIMDPTYHGPDAIYDSYRDIDFDIYLMVKASEDVSDDSFDADEDSIESIYPAWTTMVDRGLVFTGNLETDAKWLASEFERYIAKHPPGWT